MSSSATVPPIPENTALPSTWYRSQALYELERRAVFSKQWMLITHKNRLTKPGDYVRYQIAGFPFFLIMDRQNVLRGFHNVCRHRAYPVIKPDAPDSGTKSILACYYHGMEMSPLAGLLDAEPSRMVVWPERQTRQSPSI
jgi:phenylpropionate dioxygenase-like ring-hydroxylating dioxygenase large terminal subunit